MSRSDPRLPEPFEPDASAPLDMLEDQLRPLDVFGRDNRRIIEETFRYPRRAVCRLDIRFPRGASGIGTGAFIGPRTILTAAHNLWHPEAGRSLSILATPAYRHGPLDDLGQHREAGRRLHPSWRPPFPAHADLGCVVLAAPIGNETGQFGFEAWSDEALRGPHPNGVRHLGYDDRTARGEMLYQAVPAVLPRRRLLGHRLDTKSGHSGGPIYVQNDKGPIIVGVHRGGRVRYNEAVRVTPYAERLLRSWRAI